jgi:hypothetical protein
MQQGRSLAMGSIGRSIMPGGALSRAGDQGSGEIDRAVEYLFGGRPVAALAGPRGTLDDVHPSDGSPDHGRNEHIAVVNVVLTR